jgi:hypothetical protein
MKNQLLLLYFMQVITCYSQTIHSAIAPSYRPPGAYSLHFANAFSFTGNQASLANLSATNAGISTERKFMLHELSQYTGVVGIPVKSGGIGITATWCGSANYNESQAGVAYGKKLGSVDLGIQFNYAMVQLAGYGSDAAFLFEAGSIWHITDQLHAGIHIVNPQGGKFYKNHQEKMASVYEMGIGYEASEQLLIQLEIIKEEAKRVNIQAGLQYIPVKSLFAVAGISTAIAAPYFAIGWVLKNFSTDISASYHAQLGITPGIRIMFYGKK